MTTPEPLYYAKDRRAWRRWLERNHAKKDVVFLVFYKKATGEPCPTYSEAVEEALCFGWVDGVKRSLDEERYCFRFTPRRAGSKWSASNKKRVAKLEAEGRMRPAGARAVAAAKGSGAWDAPARPKPPKRPPPELREALSGSKAARSAYDGLTDAQRRAWNGWIADAKRAETRQRRARKTIEGLERGLKRPDA